MFKLFKKNRQVEVSKKVSEQAILFIKKYAIPALCIQGRIDENLFFDILNFACQCEQNMIDEQGYDRTDDYPEKERDIWGDAFVTEISAYKIDLDDLNKRLGFINI